MGIAELATGIFKNPTFIADVYIHSLILFTFLTVLFTFLIIKLSKDSFKSELEHVLGNLKPTFDNIKETPIFKYNMLDINFKNIIDKTHEDDVYVKKNNDENNNMMILINVLFWVFIIFTIILFNYNCSQSGKIDWLEILIQNVIIFSVIGLIEFLFLKLVIIKFVPVKPSFLITKTFELVKEKFS